MTDGFKEEVIASLVIQPIQMAASAAKEKQNSVEVVEQQYFSLKLALQGISSMGHLVEGIVCTFLSLVRICFGGHVWHNSERRQTGSI